MPSEPPCTPHPEPEADEELVAYLEHDQLVSGKVHPVPRARLDPRAAAGLWALRVFGLVVGAMVVYTFVAHLNG
jgi:hypothetical protein